MSIAKSQLYDFDEDDYYSAFTGILGISLNEVKLVDPQVDQYTGSDDAVYRYVISFKEDAPRNILRRIKRLDSNKNVWLNLWEWGEYS